MQQDPLALVQHLLSQLDQNPPQDRMNKITLGVSLRRLEASLQHIQEHESDSQNALASMQESIRLQVAVGVEWLGYPQNTEGKSTQLQIPNINAPDAPTFRAHRKQPALADTWEVNIPIAKQHLHQQNRMAPVEEKVQTVYVDKQSFAKAYDIPTEGLSFAAACEAALKKHGSL